MLDALGAARCLREGARQQGATLNDHAVSRSTLRSLRSSEWNFVVLQDQSDGTNLDRYPGARVLDGEAALIGAETVFFMTWAIARTSSTCTTSRGIPGGRGRLRSDGSN